MRRNIVEQLRLRRLDVGLTQAEVAHRMGVSPPFISKLESHGNRDPRIETLIRYATIVGAKIVVIVDE